VQPESATRVESPIVNWVVVSLRQNVKVTVLSTSFILYLYWTVITLWTIGMACPFRLYTTTSPGIISFSWWYLPKYSSTQKECLLGSNLAPCCLSGRRQLGTKYWSRCTGISRELELNRLWWPERRLARGSKCWGVYFGDFKTLELVNLSPNDLHLFIIYV